MKTGTITLLAALALPLAAMTQNVPLTRGQVKAMHREVAEDPYLPNAFGNQKTSPAYRTATREKTGGNKSSIYTYQANVNAQGQNIVGDAANEPSLAVNPKDRSKIAIGWRQFDNVASNFRQAGWAWTVNGGQTWTFPGVINPGKFRSDPVLDSDADGVFYYNSLTNDPDYFCKVFQSNDGGASWDEGVDAHGGDKQWMVIDRTSLPSKGFTYSFWTSYFSTCAPGSFTRSTDGDHYENCVVIDGNPYWGTMAYGNEGELYIGGASGVADSVVVCKSVSARDPNTEPDWELTVRVNIGGTPTGWSGVNPGGLLGQVNIAVDHSDGPGRNNVYVAAPVVRSNGDPADVMFARSEDGGQTWSAPVRINDDQSDKNWQWFGTMSVAPNGRIDIAWLDTRDAAAGSDSSALYYSFSLDQGKTWSPNEKMSGLFDPHVGYPNQNKLGDYFDMESDSVGAHLAWAGTFNGEQDVYYSYIVPYSSASKVQDIPGPRIVAYPNPVERTLTVGGLNPGYVIEIYSNLGQRIIRQEAVNSDAEIDLSGHPTGMYLLKVIAVDGGITVKKIALRQE